MENKVILTIELDEENTEKRIIEIRKQLDFLSVSAKSVQKQFNSGEISADDYYKELEKIKRSSTGLNTELAEQRKVLQNVDKATKSQSGSLVELRAKLSNATKAYNELSAEERNNVKIGGELNKQIKEYSDTLKGAEEKNGDFRRSVGDYAKGLNIAGVNVGDFNDKLKEGFESTKVFVKGIGSTRGALTALTAIPILLFLTAIIAFFKSTDDGADKLEQGLAGLTAGFDAVLKTLAPLGEALVNIFLHPLDALQNFTHALANPVETFNKLRKASDQMANDVATNFSVAARAAVAYTATMQNVEDNENALIAQRARVGLQVDQALLKVKDRSLSEKQKIQILRDAGIAEQKLSNLVIANAQLAFNAIKKRNDEFARGRKLTDDEVKAQLEAEANLINAQRDNLNTQQAIRNRETAQIESAEAARKASAEKRKQAEKDAIQDSVYAAELAIILAKKRNESTLKLDEELIKRQLKLSLADAKSKNQRLLLEQKAEVDIIKLKLDSAIELDNRLNGITLSNINARLALVKKGTQQEFQLQKELLEQNKKIELDNVRNTIKNADERTAKIREIEAKNYAALLELTKQFADNQLKIEADTAARKEKIRVDLLNRFKRDQDERQKKIQENLSLQLANAKEGSQDELDARRNILFAQLNQDLELVGDNEVAKQTLIANYNNETERLQEDYYRRLADTVASYLNQATDAVSTLQEALGQKQLNDLIKNEKAAVESAGNNAALREKIEENYQKKRETLEKEGAKRRKKIASIENIIQGAQAATAALISFARNPILGAITLALVAVKTVANQIMIDSQTFSKGGKPKKEITTNYYSTYTSDGRGAYIANGPGTSTSDSINARISVQESVMSAKATAKYYDELSYMNASVGGNPFPGANPISTTVAPNFQYGVIGVDTNNAASVGRAVAEQVNSVQPVLILENLNEVQATQKRIQVRTTIN